MRVALIVLGLALVTHNLYGPLAEIYFPDSSRRAAQEIFYVLQGLSVGVLSLLVLHLFKPQNERLQLVLFCTVVYSSAEQALVVGCGTAWLLRLGLVDIDAANLCNRATGWQAWLVPLIVLLAVLWRRREN